MRRPYFLLALPFLMLGTGAAPAQTLSYTQAIDLLAKACGADIKKYCKNVPLGGGRIQACFEQHRAQISASCKQTSARVYASIAKRVAAQNNIVRICSGDISRFCGQVVAGDANILNCMLKIKPSLIGRECNQTLTDTGWRSERVQQ